MRKRIKIDRDTLPSGGRFGWIDGPGFLIIGLLCAPDSGGRFFAKPYVARTGATFTFSVRVYNATLAVTLQRRGARVAEAAV